MLQLYKNIKARRLQLQMTQSELAEKLGYADKSMIAKIEKGTVDLPQSKIVAFANALNITASELMGWEENTNDTLDFATLPTNLIPLPEMKEVPLIGTIACGTPIYADENIEEYVKVPANINADFALRCQGDSMVDARIFNGDLVYIHLQDTIDNGEIAAILIGEEATLKRFYRKGSVVTLQAENKAYEPLVYVGEELNEIRIIGKAVYFLSKVK